MGSLKVYLDDRRPVPDDSWTLVATPDEALELLMTGEVIEVSLDYDLGLWDPAGREINGIAVLDYIEEAVFFNELPFPLPELSIHSDNGPGRDRMRRAREQILKLADERNIPRARRGD